MKNAVDIRSISINLIKVFVSGIVSLFLLSLFCMAYLNTGVHIRNETGATDYKWESNQYKASMVEGFTWLNMDEDGFNNAFPKSDKIDILLMGSSHMEAVNVPSDKNVGYLLNEYLPDLYTYNIGTSGHTIYTCVNNLKAAVEAYHPQRYVIIETDKIDLNCETMEAIMNGKYMRIKSYNSGIVYYLQKYVPVIKNIYKQIDDWWSCDLAAAKRSKTSKVDTVEEPPMEAGYVETLDRFLTFIRAGGVDCKIIIAYQPSTTLNSDGTMAQLCDDARREVFSRLCEKNDIIFVDASAAFAKLYKEQYILAHGFTNTAVGVGHLNEYGHRAVAELLAQVIKEAQ